MIRAWTFIEILCGALNKLSVNSDYEIVDRADVQTIDYEITGFCKCADGIIAFMTHICRSGHLYICTICNLVIYRLYDL